MREPVCGIYKIVCLRNNKVYIGSSVDVVNRWWDHKARLNANQHCNPHLQRAWNKYGEKHFLFDIIEQCNEEEQYQREQHWIDKTRAADGGFNISPDATGGATSKEWIVTSPSGKEELVQNLNRFCRKHKLNHSGMCHVAHGLASQYKGWLCRPSQLSREQWEIIRRNGKFGGGWKGEWRITDPQGNVCVVESLTAYCRERGLSQGNMTEVATGKRRQHKGYRCEKYHGNL